MTKKRKNLINQDPHYKRELEKYGNPIPSREFILSVIRDNNAPMNRDEILTALSLPLGKGKSKKCNRSFFPKK